MFLPEMDPRPGLSTKDPAMKLADWVIDLALIALVLVQLRGRRLTFRSQLLPVALVVWAAAQYLRGIPTAGNDLLLIVPAALVGLGLGLSAGLLTLVYRNPTGEIIARATVIAAVLWILGVGFRLVFQLYATHGGGVEIGRFSAEHRIDLTAWTPAILLMALCEVLARTGVVAWRGRLLSRAHPSAAL